MNTLQLGLGESNKNLNYVIIRYNSKIVIEVECVVN